MTKYDLEKSISPQKGKAASVPLFLILICVIFTSSLQAQPVNRWIRFFDGQNDRDEFFDIFATAEGGYAVAGYSYLDRQHNGFWIVLADNDGGELWRRTYTDERFPRAGTWCYSLIQADDGGFLLGGRARDANQRYNFSLLRVSADGERLWWRIYEEPNNSQCRAVIELKSGEFIGVGRGGEEGEAYAVMVNGDGDVLWENTYPGELFYALRETQGGLLFAGWTAISGSSERWLLKTDFDGEVLWSRTYNAGKLLSLVSCPEGGFAAGGHNFPGEDVNWSLLRVNDEGEQLWNRFYDIGESDQFACLTCLFDGGFALVGTTSPRHGLPTILRTDSAGNIQWSRTDNNNINGGDGGDRYTSVIEGPDNMIMVAGVTNREEERGPDGVLLKIVPERSPPNIWSYIPEGLEFSVLQHDSIFIAILEASDAQNDSLLYIWTFDGDTVSADTSTTITFDELDDHFVECFVSDGDQAVSVHWLVHVEEFFIRSFEPDSLGLIVQRSTEIDFEIDIAALEEVEVENLWTLTNRNQREEEIGNDPDISIMFDQSGHNQLQALLSHEEETDEVTWTIDVRSAVWSWWPSELELSVYVDSTLEFVITPFNEESDSLEYVWLLDDEQLESDSASVFITFPETGQNELTSIVSDGIEADTLRWTIDVEEWSFTAENADLADLPTSPMLYPASPNPFNSSVKLSMYLPRGNHILLSIFDLNGREVSRLVDGDVAPGNRTFVWNASDFPAGVYIVKMNAGDKSEMQKVVLVR